MASLKVKLRYKLLTELRKKKMVERGDKQSEGFEGGSRDIGLAGQIKRKWKGATFQRRHATMKPGISSIDVYHAINMPVPTAISLQLERRGREEPAKGVWLINSKGDNGRVRFHAFYQGFAFILCCCCCCCVSALGGGQN